MRAQVTQDRPCRSCAAETAGLPRAGIDGEAVCLNPQPLRILSLPRARVRPSPSLSRAPPGSADSSAWNSFIPMHANGSGMACSLLPPAAAFAVQCAGPCSRVFGSCCFPLAVRPDDFSSGTWTCSTCERQLSGHAFQPQAVGERHGAGQSARQLLAALHHLENQQLAVLLGPNYDCWQMCPVECSHCRGTQHYLRMQNPYF